MASSIGGIRRLRRGDLVELGGLCFLVVRDQPEGSAFVQVLRRGSLLMMAAYKLRVLCFYHNALD